MRQRPRRIPRPLILIADDSGDTREMYALYLRTAGYNVETAEDGHAAVLKARATRPDLIVMDLQMPKLDGWGAMKELENDPRTRGIPVIAMTGHDLKGYLKTAALAGGAFLYLTKPTLPERLAREIGQRLATRRPRAASAP
jgi:CheY-like chemotaxis protein